MQHLQYIEHVLHHNLMCSYIDNIMCLWSRKRKYINIHYLNKGLFCFLLKYLFTFIFLKITVEKELYTKSTLKRMIPFSVGLSQVVNSIKILFL